MDRKLIKSVFFNVGYNILASIVPFITAPYLGRVLGAEKVGTYTYIQSIGNYFLMFGMLGMSNYGNKTIAMIRESREGRSKVFWEIYCMQLCTGMIAFFAYFGSLFLFDHKHLPIALSVGIFVATGCFNIDWFCQGMEDYARIAKRTLIIRIVNIVFIFLFVKTGDDLLKYSVIMSTSNLASSFMLWPYVKKSVDFIRPKFADILPHFKKNILLFLPAIAASIYQVMDKIMIGGIAGETDLAYYEYAEKITQLPMLLFTALGTVMLSRMSYVFQKDESEAFDTIAYSMDLSFAIGSLFTFGLAAVADEIVTVYYGEAFLPSGLILTVLVPIILMYGWSNVIRMQYVIPNNFTHVYIIATIVGAAVNLLFNMALIPRCQAVGAAIGTLVAQFAVAAVYTVLLRKRLPLKHYAKREFPLLIIGLLMGVIVVLFSKTHEISLPWLLADILLGTVVFCILYIAFGWHTKDNLASKLVCLARSGLRR